MKSIVLAGGCFWCLDAAYRQVKGVTEVISGYAGGHVPNPDYYQVADGQTGHAESVKVTFDETVVSEDDILSIFWILHDPTSLNRQGADIGSQYRSAVFYADENQLMTVKESKKKAQHLLDSPIVTEIALLRDFYPAETEHQDYFGKHPDQAYCQVVINPKLKKLRNHFASLLE